jgi:hypothetical protein
MAKPGCIYVLFQVFFSVLMVLLHFCGRAFNPPMFFQQFSNFHKSSKANFVNSLQQVLIKVGKLTAHKTFNFVLKFDQKLPQTKVQHVLGPKNSQIHLKMSIMLGRSQFH